MVVASSGANPSEEIAKFAANLTIDNEEYEAFAREQGNAPAKPQPKLAVHASTQDAAVERNFEAAADKNSFEMLSMFGMKVQETPPGQ